MQFYLQSREIWRAFFTTELIFLSGCFRQARARPHFFRTKVHFDSVWDIPYDPRGMYYLLPVFFWNWSSLRVSTEPCFTMVWNSLSTQRHVKILWGLTLQTSFACFCACICRSWHNQDLWTSPLVPVLRLGWPDAEKFVINSLLKIHINMPKTRRKRSITLNKSTAMTH